MAGYGVGVWESRVLTRNPQKHTTEGQEGWIREMAPAYEGESLPFVLL